MLACWQTYRYFNIDSNIVNKKMPKKKLFLVTFFPIEIGTLSPIISLKHAEFLALMGNFILYILLPESEMKDHGERQKRKRR